MAVMLRDVTLPEFGVPKARPEPSRALYAARLDRLRRRARDAGLTALVVYADREHCANMAYLLDFDPRFEEAQLILVEGRRPVVMTGPENIGRAAASKVEVDTVLYPPFGLLGQDRSALPPTRVDARGVVGRYADRVVCVFTSQTAPRLPSGSSAGDASTGGDMRFVAYTRHEVNSVVDA